MPPILRNILAAIAGIVIGSLVNMAIIVVGPLVIPLPEGVDLSNAETFAENLKRLAPINFLTPWLAHALGTLAGAFAAAKIAASHRMTLAFVIAAFFLCGGIMMVALFGGPLWFAVLDLLGAYLPMGYLGGFLAGAGKRQGK